MTLPCLKIACCTIFSLVMFAGNSVLCRMALGEGRIDAGGFTLIRLVSGILVLIPLTLIFRGEGAPRSYGSWPASFMLFLYAAAFSYAYLSLDTGTGALILFGMVQITMITSGLISGDRLALSEWTGTAVAFMGFVYLLMPGSGLPSIKGFLLMAVAGAAWGIYTLNGRASVNPLSDTVYNFLRTTPMLLVMLVFIYPGISLSGQGMILAAVSGAVASGIGYAVWYAALKGLSTPRAAVVQLLVPVMAAAGGVVFSNETISLHLAVSSAMVLGGIALVLTGRYSPGRSGDVKIEKNL